VGWRAHAQHACSRSTEPPLHPPATAHDPRSTRTWMHAAMQLSFERLFQPGSCTSGGPRRMCTVNSRMPRSLGPAARVWCVCARVRVCGCVRACVCARACVCVRGGGGRRVRQAHSTSPAHEPRVLTPTTRGATPAKPHLAPPPSTLAAQRWWAAQHVWCRQPQLREMDVPHGHRAGKWRCILQPLIHPPNTHTHTPRTLPSVTRGAW
jgi:hypothetical protein